MPRNSIRFVTPGDLRCFDCGHEYDFIGSSHPGVCPECASRAVSLSGDVEVRGIFTAPGGVDAITTLDIIVADETSRPITFTATSCDGLVTMELAILGNARIKAGTAAWNADLVPQAVVDALEDRGDEFIPCTNRPDRRDGARR